MSKTDAAYMRAYRARKKHAETAMELARQSGGDSEAITARGLARIDRIAELEEEVRHLKEELAQRPPYDIEEGETLTIRHGNRVVYEQTDGPSFNTRPFTPVPKKGK